jgi:alcohol dehydrogenase (cytochrome c)
MNRNLRLSLSALLLATVSTVPSFAAEVTQQRLENADAEPQNWLTVFQNYSSHRYSRLDQINRDNIGDLHMVFAMPLSFAMRGVNSANLENAPLVVDGALYVNDEWGTIYKADVTSGDAAVVQWIADPAMDKEGARGILTTRGIAALDNRIFANLPDGRVIAVDADTGEIVWDMQIARTEEDWDYDAIEGFTAAPLATEGQVLVGQSMGDWGTRGWLAAVDAETGEENWRTYTIPGPGEPGHETWKDDHNAWRTGGGALWTTGSYDVDQRVTIWGTANPVPMYDPQFRPGDNLYTNSALAMNIDDGSIKWYFQYTQNESWDYDEIGVHFLYDAEINGATRSVVGHFARNGYFYQLDRNTGEFIDAVQYVNEITWTAGLDPKTGKPVEYDPNLDVQVYIPETRNSRENPNVTVCPSHLGGVRWQPPAYNPERMVAFVAGTDACSDITVAPEVPIEVGGNPRGVGQVWLGGTGTAKVAPGLIAAVDVRSGEILAKVNPPHHNLSGVLATAGGLIFTGQQDGAIVGFNDETLEEMWRFNGGIPFKSPPISYAIDDRQFIAITAGGSGGGGYEALAAQGPRAGAMLFVFAL